MSQAPSNPKLFKDTKRLARYCSRTVHIFRVRAWKINHPKNCPLPLLPGLSRTSIMKMKTESHCAHALFFHLEDAGRQRGATTPGPLELVLRNI